MGDIEIAHIETQAKSWIVLNGNSIANKLSKNNNLDRPLSGFVVPNRWVIEEILRKISMDPDIAWKKGKHCYKIVLRHKNLQIFCKLLVEKMHCNSSR